MPDAEEFYWDTRRIYRGAILLLILAAPGLLLLTMEGVETKALGVAWTTALAALAATVYSRSFKSEPVITVSIHGFHDRRVSTSSIPWARIDRVGEFDAENVGFVGIDFDDPKLALADAKPVVRLLAPVHRLFRFPTVSINTSLLDVDDRELVAAIKRFRSK